MKTVKRIVSAALGFSVLLINGLPVYGKSSVEPSILGASLDTGIETVEKTGDIISESLDSITIEDVQPVTTYEAEYIPTYSYSEPYAEVLDTSTTMTVDEFMALYGQQEETVPVDTSSQEEAYNTALANYNAALTEYEAANQMIETTKEVEVEIIEEVTDEEGNISEIVRTEIQTVTEMVPAGDVVSAQANLDAAKAALDNAQMALDAARNSTAVVETVKEDVEPEASIDTQEEQSIIDDDVEVKEEKTSASSGYCGLGGGTNLSWTLDDSGNLIISGSGQMQNYYGTWNPPWKPNVKTAVIQNGVTSIGNAAFVDCSKLISITIPTSVTEIGELAFTNCSSLKDVYYDGTPAEWSSVTQLSIDLPSSATIHYTYTSSGTAGDNVTWILKNDVLTLSGSGPIYDYYYSTGRVPEWNQEEINQVIIGNGITYIGSAAFGNCTNLTNVQIASSVAGIGRQAFAGCTSLNNIVLPTGVQYISSGAFLGCSNLTSITIPVTVTSIWTDVFNGCTSLTDVYYDGTQQQWSSLSSNYKYGSNVTIHYKDVTVTYISLDKTALDLSPGSQSQITATVSPKNAYYTDVTWSSSNTAVATVNNGLVKAISVGTATITAKSHDGSVKETCTVTVRVPVSSVSLSETSRSLSVNESFVLKATVYPTNATNKNVTWSSSDSSVATVSNGVVKALKEGEAIIKVKTEDGYHTASCNVTVSNPVSGIALDHTEAVMNIYDTLQLNATLYPDDATNKNITWSSSNTSIATVSSKGLITAKAVGETTITAKTSDGGFTATCHVKVVRPVTGVSLNKTSATLNNGESLQLTATISPSSATNKNVTWSSNDTSVATVSNGLVKAVGKGTAVIKVVTEDGGYSATCNITVNQPATGITISQTSGLLYIGDTLQLEASVKPANADNPAFSWSSDKTSVASVSSDGLVTAKSAGTAIIKAISADGGYEATCTITVVKHVNGISLNKTSSTINTEDSLYLTATVTPSDAYNKNVTWTSSNTSVATVSTTGQVIGKKAGTVTITAKTEDGSYTATCRVTVLQPVKSVSLNKTSAIIYEGDSLYLTKNINPSDASNQTVTWTSSNTSVATVSTSGTVKGIKAGTATITVTTQDGGYKASCKVTVYEHVTGISLDITSSTIKTGETVKLTPTITPANANKEVTWNSSNSKVAAVSNGLVTGVKAGKAKIIVNTVDGSYFASCEITVIQPAQGITMSTDTLEMVKGEQKQLRAVVLPEDTTMKAVTWTSSDAEIATVSRGVVTGHKKGTAVITATTMDGGYKATCQVTVKDMPFIDVPDNSWYYDVAKECYETGLINGTSAVTFSPMQEMTRAMVVTILWRMDGSPNMEFNDKFSDVPSSQWYANPITWAEKSGVVHGYGDGTFKPDDAVTREQIAVMLSNYATYKKSYQAGTADFTTYPDGDQVSTWAASGMKWALSNGIISGNGAGYLNPKKSATRAEGAAMLLRMKNWL